MLIGLLLNVVVLIIGAVFSWLPIVDTLPTIVDYDIDAALVTGAGQLHTVLAAFWPLAILMQGFFALCVYYVIKVSLKFFLGGRSPTD